LTALRATRTMWQRWNMGCLKDSVSF
jgi:hypothetical protein